MEGWTRTPPLNLVQGLFDFGQKEGGNTEITEFVQTDNYVYGCKSQGREMDPKYENISPIIMN